MNVKELKEALSLFPDYAEVMIDIDDFKELNAQNLAHIFTIANVYDDEPVLILDADWGKNKPNDVKILRSYKGE